MSHGNHILGMKVHLPGCGDFVLKNVELLSDPCPPPAPGDKTRLKRRLDERDKLIYAPMSDVDGVLYDRDATFVTMPNYNEVAGQEGWVTKSQHCI
jgi:GTP-binding protein required for 40S ribosome biogenesis